MANNTGRKYGGRRHGTPNKVTAEIRETLKTILNREIDILPELLEKMKPEKRAEILTRLLPFIMPKNYTIEDQNNVIIDWRNDD